MRKTLTVMGNALVLTFMLFIIVDSASAVEKLTQIADDVYAYVDTKNSAPGNSFGANAGIIIGKDGIVVVDTLISAKEAKRFIRDIRKISRKPIRYVVNTHYHLDHVFGNSEFAKLGAVIVAQENALKAIEHGAKETLKNIRSYGLTAKDMEGTKIVYPALTFGNKMTIDIGGQRIELIHLRHAHTDGDALVYLPGKKILFTGDVLFTDYHPFVGEGNIEEWAKELDEIKAMDVEKIIPGHGPLSGKRDLDEMKEYIVKFDQKAKELVAQSENAQEIATAIRNAMPKRSENAGLIIGNIQSKYLKKR